MAEAKSAVAFSFNITPDGIHLDYDTQAVKAVWWSGVHDWRARIIRFRNHVINSLHPAPPMSFMLVVAVVMGLQLYAEVDLSFGFIDYITATFPWLATFERTAMAFAIGLLAWVAFILVWRLSLKLLLSWHGWMYEEHGKISLVTKVWMLALKVLKGGKPRLCSFQASLPKLPVPSLSGTKERYLRSVRPLLDDTAYNRMSKLADEFFSGVGKKLQLYLILKSWWATNYVADWWEEYVYLYGRSPIMVNSNYYGLDGLLVQNTSNQAARAGTLAHALLKYREVMDHENMKPLMALNAVPLCSAQYERMYSTSRVPGVTSDSLVHYRRSHHLAVYSRGRYYKVQTHWHGQLLKARDLEAAFQKILDDSSQPVAGEEHLAALTAGERTPWGRAREQHFSSGVNKASLHAIDKAAFFLVLDADVHCTDGKDLDQLAAYGRSLLHGKCYDRWFDKSFTLIIFKNARTGFNAEHSWADAPVMSQAWEYMFHQELFVLKYADDGHCTGTVSAIVPEPVRLQWDFSAECIDAIESSLRVARNLASDVDLCILPHTAFGKRVMKKARVSPDAFIQAALQLAYYRDVGKFCLTYESAMTRLFREGRTETVRSCTSDTCRFVLAMEDKAEETAKKVALLQAAANTHQGLYRDAMTGKGIDRHLFCLFVVSKYLGIESPFLKEVLSEPWRLSTSQTPHSTLNLVDTTKYPDYIAPGGGFGPVSDDGYGISYMLSGEDNIYFHICCKASCPTTNAKRFCHNIERALADVKALFD